MNEVPLSAAWLPIKAARGLSGDDGTGGEREELKRLPPASTLDLDFPHFLPHNPHNPKSSSAQSFSWAVLSSEMPWAASSASTLSK